MLIMLSSEGDREREGKKLKSLHENQNISCHCLIAREFKKNQSQGSPRFNKGNSNQNKTNGKAAKHLKTELRFPCGFVSVFHALIPN